MILGFWEIILVIAITFGNLFLSILVIRNDPKGPKNRAFFFLSLFVSFWILSAFISEIFPLSYPQISLICSKIAVASTLLATFFFFHFSLLSFSHLPSWRIRQLYFWGLTVTLFCSLLIFLSQNVIKGLNIYPDGNFDIIYGPLYYHLILPFIIFLLILALTISFKGYSRLSPLQRNRFYYFLLGIGFFVISNIIFNLIVPILINTDIYYRIGNYSSILLLGCTAYAIVARRLFSIKLAITEITIGIIGFLLLINLLGSHSTWEYAWRGGIFLAFSVVGILLIRAEHKEIEYRKKLEISFQKLRQLDKAKSEFLSIASHQLRTPLSIMKGYLSMILEGSYGNVSPKIRNITENLFQTNEQLIKLVNNLLNVSRIEAGKMEMSLENISITNLIKETIKEIEPEAKKKGLYIVYKEKTKIPYIQIDPDKIKQVLLNILDNAIKYTERGGINITSEIQNSHVLIKITDTGVGMTREEIQNIFSSFKRGEAGEKFWTGGSGLGLYVAKKFVEMHKGKIWAESEGPGKGSTFHIELPIS